MSKPKCATCRFKGKLFETIECCGRFDAPLIECRRRAPICDMRGNAVVPLVKPDNWCGEHEPDETPTRVVEPHPPTNVACNKCGEVGHGLVLQGITCRCGGTFIPVQGGC